MLMKWNSIVDGTENWGYPQLVEIKFLPHSAGKKRVTCSGHSKFLILSENDPARNSLVLKIILSPTGVASSTRRQNQS